MNQKAYEKDMVKNLVKNLLMHEINGNAFPEVSIFHDNAWYAVARMDYSTIDGEVIPGLKINWAYETKPLEEILDSLEDDSVAVFPLSDTRYKQALGIGEWNNMGENWTEITSFYGKKLLIFRREEPYVPEIVRLRIVQYLN